MYSAVEPTNKGYVRDNINSAVLSFIEKFPPLEVLSVLKLLLGSVIFGTLSNILIYGEVYYDRDNVRGSLHTSSQISHLLLHPSLWPTSPWTK